MPEREKQSYYFKGLSRLRLGFMEKLGERATHCNCIRYRILDVMILWDEEV